MKRAQVTTKIDFEKATGTVRQNDYFEVAVPSKVFESGLMARFKVSAGSADFQYTHFENRGDGPATETAVFRAQAPGTIELVAEQHGPDGVPVSKSFTIKVM